MERKYPIWSAGLLASVLIFVTVFFSELTVKAVDPIIPISGNAMIVANGIYELTGDHNNLREIQIADGVTDVQLLQENSLIPLTVSITTHNTGTLTLTIKGLNITSEEAGTLELRGSGEVRLVLEGENSLITTTPSLPKTSAAAINVEGAAKIAISGDGSLYAKSGEGAAGIGSSAYNATGTIVINGGTIHAEATNSSYSNSGAGIGGGYSSLPGVININGGNIHAIGAGGGAGIGGGSGGASATIVINGGQIAAQGSYLLYNQVEYSGAGIGGGSNSNGGTIVITGGHIVASGGGGLAAGIGAGVMYNDGYVPETAEIQLHGWNVNSAPGYNGESYIGEVKNEDGVPLLRLTLSFVKFANSQPIAVNGAQINVNGALLTTDANGKINLYVPAGSYQQSDFVLTGADGFRRISLTPETIQVAVGQQNEAVVEWSNHYEVTWHLNGGTMNSTEITSAVYGTSVAAPQSTPARSGYSFDGWYADEQYVQRIQFPIVLAGDTNFYAKWSVYSPSPHTPEFSYTPVIPERNANTNLAELQVKTDVNELQISPSFSPATTAYILRTQAEKIAIDMKAATSASSVSLNNQPFAGALCLDLEWGVNSFVITVKAENGTIKTYKLDVYREIAEPKDSTVQPPDTPLIGFADIAGHWAEEDIKHAASIGIVRGYPDGTLKANHSVTRAEFIVMLAGAMHWEHDETNSLFSDQNAIGDWAKKAIGQAVQAKIIRGYEDGSFRPDAFITRVEMLAMISRVLQLPSLAEVTSFSDDELIPQWAKGFVEDGRLHGVVNGRNGNRFEPFAPATRAESVVMVLRMLDQNQ